MTTEPRKKEQFQPDDRSQEQEQLQSKSPIRAKSGAGSMSQIQSQNTNAQVEAFKVPLRYFMALFWCVGAGLLRGMVNAGQKIGSQGEKPIPEIHYYIMFRCAFMVVLSYCLGKYNGINFDKMGWTLFRSFDWETQKQIMWRVFYGYVSQWFQIYAVEFLPLAVSQSLLNCSMFVTIILSYLILGEKLSWREIVTIVGGMGGILILVNPGWFGYKVDYSAKDKSGQVQVLPSTLDYYIGIFLALSYSVLTSMKLIALRAIGENIHTSVKNYYFGLFGALFTLFANIFLQPRTFLVWEIGSSDYAITRHQMAFYCIVGLMGCFSQECIAQALSAVKSGTMAGFQTIAIIIGFLVDIFYFDDQVPPTSYIGAACIIIFPLLQGVISNFDNTDENAEKRDAYAKENARRSDQRKNEQQRINNDIDHERQALIQRNDGNQEDIDESGNVKLF